VVDEIGNAKEAAAVKGSAQRGVVFIGTAHGVALGNLVANPELNSLVGGTQAVILSDVEARRALPPYFPPESFCTDQLLWLRAQYADVFLGAHM